MVKEKDVDVMKGQ